MMPPGLRCFLAVAQAGSMREAALRLRLAQSAISRRIQQLEEELGVQLLERGARGVGMTPAGEILLHHGREATQLTERLRADLDALRGVRRGHVVVRLVESFAASGLSSALASFRAAYPAVTLDISVVGSEAILAALRVKHATAEKAERRGEVERQLAAAEEAAARAADDLTREYAEAASRIAALLRAEREADRVVMEAAAARDAAVRDGIMPEATRAPAPPIGWVR